VKKEYVDIDKIYLTGPRLMSLPPREIELKIERDLNEKLRKEGKRKLIVCCRNSREIIYEIGKLGITENELQILINSLHKHPYDRFGRNRFRIEKTFELDYQLLIDEVFEISTLFEKEEVQTLFLKSFYNLVQLENTNPRWTIALAKFNKHWKNRILGIDKKNIITNEGKTINMKIENINNYGNLQIADLIINNSNELSQNDRKLVQLIHENISNEEEKKELIENLETIRSENSTKEEKKKSGGLIGKFLESVSSESGKQIAKEIFENGDKIWEYIQNIPT